MKARILIVEDETIVQLDLQNQLRRLGHAVVGSAVSGEEAIAKVDELKPDLVLMDVKLEGKMDGIEAADQIRATHAVPIVYLTAYAGNLAPQQQMSLHPCVSKPFRTVELQTAILHALAKSNPTDPQSY